MGGFSDYLSRKRGFLRQVNSVCEESELPVRGLLGNSAAASQGFSVTGGSEDIKNEVRDRDDRGISFPHALPSPSFAFR